MNIFYAPDAVLNQHVVLDEQESFHITRVLRKKVSEELFVFDGKGNLFDGRISAIGKKDVTVHLVRWMEKVESDRPKLHIAIAPPKNIDRFEWFLEKATEIGVSEIVPLICERTEKQQLKMERLNGILISAMLQSQQAWLPVLQPAIKYIDYVTQAKADESLQKFIAHCEEDKKTLLSNIQPTVNNTILIGPEGDFTHKEIELAIECGFEPVSLGQTRLRTETAAMVAVVLLNK